MNSSMNYSKEFIAAMNWLWPIEGGYWPGGKTDPNPTNYGITQKTLNTYGRKYGITESDVKNISRADAMLIYYNEYWLTSGCLILSNPMDLIVFDTAVNCGVGNALMMKHRTDDPQIYLMIRAQYYYAISIDHPELAPNLKGWDNRIEKLRIQCHLSAIF